MFCIVHIIGNKLKFKEIVILPPNSPVVLEFKYISVMQIHCDLFLYCDTFLGHQVIRPLFTIACLLQLLNEPRVPRPSFCMKK